MSSTKILIIVVAVIVLGLMSWSVLMKQSVQDGAMMEKNDTATVTSEESMVKSEEMMIEKKDDGVMMVDAGSYEVYSPEKIAKAESGKVVLFFRAGWCPTCRTLDADIRANLKNIPSDVTILDVDYDNSTVLKQKYGVTYQHTLVQVDASGEQITKWSGVMTLADVLKNIK